MVVHRGGGLGPLVARILELPDHLSLLRVHADDGQPEALELLPGRRDAPELAVAIDSGAAGERLVVDVKCEVELLEEPANGVAADPDARPAQLATDLVRGLVDDTALGGP